MKFHIIVTSIEAILGQSLTRNLRVKNGSITNLKNRFSQLLVYFQKKFWACALFGGLPLDGV